MLNSKPVSGSVLRFERSSIHDGQGLRTVVFLKGCPLNCAWCSTPESKIADTQRGYDYTLCSFCGKCVEHCSAGALSFSENKLQVKHDPAKCHLCFNCQKVCPGNAIKRYGLQLSVAEVVAEIAKDEIFFFHSGGGVTLSGGEPLSQPEFASAIFEQCKNIGINTAVESSFHLDFANIERVIPWLDLIYVDIKHMDSSIHKKWTGEGNSQILENLRKADLLPNKPAIIIRIPLVPGINDSDKNLSSTLDFCRGLNIVKEIELLAYHRLGSDTYRHLGLDYPCRNLVPQSREQLLERATFMKEQNSGFSISIGSGFI